MEFYGKINFAKKDAKILSKDAFELCVNLIEDRNLTSHGYNENLAEEISRRIPRYCNLMRLVLQKTS
jgi:hypothetical protein